LSLQIEIEPPVALHKPACGTGDFWATEANCADRAPSCRKSQIPYRRSNGYDAAVCGSVAIFRAFVRFAKTGGVENQSFVISPPKFGPVAAVKLEA
jgi:hypothetical protein